jgi:multiple sugar transport system substrate-binding protein
VQLVISRWAGSHADDQASMLGEFEKATGIHVRMDAIDYGQLRQKQMLNMGGKTGAYDLVFAQEVWIPEYVSSGYLHALNDYLNDPALTGKDFDFPDFEPSLVQSDTMNSKLYGLPTFVQTPLVVFNKDVFGKLGLQTPKTWDDTLSIASKLHQQATGIALPAKEGLAAVDVWIALARSNKGGYFDSAGKLDLVTPENIAACQFWKDLAGVSMRGSTNWHFDDVNKAVQFAQAPYGITISGLAGQLEDAKESKVAGKIGYAPLPFKQRPFGTLSVWSWCLTADSKHPKEAFRLAAWLTGKQVEKAMSLKNGQRIVVAFVGRLWSVRCLFDCQFPTKVRYDDCQPSAAWKARPGDHHASAALRNHELDRSAGNVCGTDPRPYRDQSALCHLAGDGFHPGYPRGFGISSQDRRMHANADLLDDC